ncbi:hypothetical protein ACHAXT_007741 [Thalassiosira profunda]
MSKRTAAPSSHYYNNDGVRERWPVLVYRQVGNGWEVLDPPGNDTPAKGNGPKKGNGAAVNTPGEEMTIAPRLGCIEIKKIRMRLKLFEQHKRWDHDEPPSRGEGQRNEAGTPIVSDEDSFDSNAPGSWNNNALVVRRGNTLLVTMRSGAGAMVFGFKSTQECLDFCDRLVYLNRDYFTPPSSNGEDDMGKKRARYEDNDESMGNALDQREFGMEERRGFKRHRGDVIRGNDVSERKMLLAPQREEGGFWLKEEGPDMAEKAQQSQKQEQIMSYIAKLAHSEEFRGFVDEIERGLESARDTAAIHAALGA